MWNFASADKPQFSLSAETKSHIQKYYTSDKGKLATKAANLRYYTKHRAKILLKHREKLLLKQKNLAIKKDESKLDVIEE